MTQQRSDEAIRADIAVMDASAMWSDRYHDALIRVLRDIEPLLARAEHAEAQIRAAEMRDAQIRRDLEHTFNNSVDGSDRHELASLILAALAAGLSLQEEQPKHLVGAGGWRACDTAADWAGSDTAGVTCAECLATTTDALQEEQE